MSVKNYLAIRRQDRLMLFLYMVLLFSGMIGWGLYLKAKFNNKLNQMKRKISVLEERQKMVDLIHLSHYINNRIPELSKKNAFEKAIIIRNHLYQNIPLKRTSKNFNFMNFSESYIKSVDVSEYGHICGGLAKLYVAALESVGIPARYVGLFPVWKEELYDSHATVEFFYMGKWYASDPTFNCMMKYNGNYISYSDYFFIKEKKKVKIDYNGFEISDRRRLLENYSTPLEKMSRYIIISPSHYFYENKIFDTPVQLFPKSWDGVVRMMNGNITDMKLQVKGGMYGYLGQGILR